MVQRYIEGGYGASEMEEDAQGDWVKYDDYAALEEKLKSLAHAIVNAGFDPVGSPDFELAESVVSDN